MKIKTGDKVKILAGKDKGKTGEVMQVFPDAQKVVVEGVNLTTKHLRGTSQQPGKKVEFPAPLHMSNVALLGKGDKTGRVGYDVQTKDGKTTKTRVLRKAGNTETL